MVNKRSCYHRAVIRSDTTPAAEAVQLQVLAGMSGEKRLLLAIEMSEFARELAKEGIRLQHPDWPETLVVRELIRLAFFPKPLPAGI